MTYTFVAVFLNTALLVTASTGGDCSEPLFISSVVKSWIVETVHEELPSVELMGKVDFDSNGDLSPETCDGTSYKIQYPSVSFNGVESARMITGREGFLFPKTINFVYMSACNLFPEIKEKCSSCHDVGCLKEKNDLMRRADPLLRAYLLSKLVNQHSGDQLVRRALCLSDPSTPVRWSTANAKVDVRSNTCAVNTGFARGMGVESVEPGDLSYKISQIKQDNYAKDKNGNHLRTDSNELYADLTPEKSKRLFRDTLAMGKRVLGILNGIHSHGLVLDSMWSTYFVSPVGGSEFNKLILGNILAIVPMGFEVKKTLNMPNDLSHHNAPWESPQIEIAPRGYRDDLFDLIELMNEMLSLGKYPRSRIDNPNWKTRSFFDASSDSFFSHITYFVGVMADIQTELNVFLQHVLTLSDVHSVPDYDLLFEAIRKAEAIIQSAPNK